MAETFGPQHRPVIEFAVDNVQKLKLHKANQQFQRNRQNESEAHAEDIQPGNDLKRRTRDGDKTGPVEENASGFKKKRPMRPREQRKQQATPEEKSLSVKEDAGNKKGQWKKRQQESTEKPTPKNVSKDVSDAPRKRKFEEVRGGEKVNSRGGPPEVQDKLDMLIEQYRSKFSQSSAKTGPQKQSSGQVRRWFQS